MSCEFFPPALADGLSLKSEWQQDFSGLQDTSQYSGWSYKYHSFISNSSSLPTKILSYLPIPPLGQDMTLGQILSGV